MSSKLLLIITLLVSGYVQATVVEVRTSMGNIQINLFDEVTPQNVDNFLIGQMIFCHPVCKINNAYT